MHKEHHTPTTDIEGGIEVMHHDNPAHPERSIKDGYEITDMNSRIIVISLIGLLVLMWGACVVIVMVVRGFNESRPSLNTAAASSLATPGIQTPDEPHLQGFNVVVDDRKRIDAENLVKVTSYGVVSEEAGMERVRIPVERSMALLAEGKVPYRQVPVMASETPVDEDIFADPSAAEAVLAPAEEDIFADPSPESEAAPVPVEAPAQP